MLVLQYLILYDVSVRRDVSAEIVLDIERDRDRIATITCPTITIQPSTSKAEKRRVKESKAQIMRIIRLLVCSLVFSTCRNGGQYTGTSVVIIIENSHYYVGE